MKKKTEKTERFVAKATTFAAEKVGLRKNSSLTTGSGDLRSISDEREDEDGGEDEEPVDPPRPVAAVLAADHGERRRRDRAGARHEARHVELPALGILALGQRDGRDGEGDRTEAETEPEDAPPARPVRQHAADHRAEREARGPTRPPRHRERGPARALGVDVANQRKRPGLGGRRAEPHHDPPGDEDARGRCDRRDDGAGAEDDDAGEHHLLPSEQVAERAAGEHQRGEREHVAVDDPLQAADAALSDVWMSASATLTIVLSRKVRKRIAQRAARAAPRE